MKMLFCISNLKKNCMLIEINFLYFVEFKFIEMDIGLIIFSIKRELCEKCMYMSYIKEIY